MIYDILGLYELLSVNDCLSLETIIGLLKIYFENDPYFRDLYNPLHAIVLCFIQYSENNLLYGKVWEYYFGKVEQSYEAAKNIYSFIIFP